jgi:mannose-6-phosphate isomerase-like protein (cupin superfamily)
MDWQTWHRQALPSSAIQRGGVTVWPVGGSGLIGDSLGPVMHVHDGASEIFFFVSGRCRLEVGNRDEVFEPGDFVLVPPEVPHNLWNAGDDELLVFWMVAPNFVDNKWRTQGFELTADASAIRGHLEPGDLPSDENIRSRVLTLREEVSLSGVTGPTGEAVLYLTDGVAEATVDGDTKTLSANEFVHVPPGTRYSVSVTGAPGALVSLEVPGD